jgi:Activin types I and II receptor domain.
LFSGLLCCCDICPESNHTCETDGYCFTSTFLDKATGVISYNYRYVYKHVYFLELGKAEDSDTYQSSSSYFIINIFKSVDFGADF